MIYALLHCLFKIFFFLSDSKDPLSLFLYCRQVFLVSELFPGLDILYFKTLILNVA